MSQDALGRVGFSNGPIYDAGRPSYCADAVTYLIQGLHIEPGRVVLDLGAGTGKLTEQLLTTKANLIAVEPSSSMRETFSRNLPSVPILDGTGEDIPLNGGSVDAVVVAQAFHWFDAPRALDEIARVLRPGGSLGLIWNERDESVEWVQQLSMAMQWDRRQPYLVGTDFRPTVLACASFSNPRRERFHFHDIMDHQRVRQRVLSTSYIASSTQAEQDAIMADVNALLARLPDPVSMPYVADSYLFDTTIPILAT